MIILNKRLEVIYPIDINCDYITKLLILRKAYKGYVYYNTLDDNEGANYYNFNQFKEMDLWKIKFSFQIYLERVKGIPSLGFNPSNKTLLIQYFKNLL